MTARPAIAKGHARKGRRRRRIVCDLDPDEFERVREAELPGCRSMAERIRLLIEWGLEAFDEERGR